MSLEIGEIGVRMAVRGQSEKTSSSDAGSALTEAERARIVEECARLVLSLLHRREAR